MQQAQLYTNYFNITWGQGRQLYYYDVKWQPELDSSNLTSEDNTFLYKQFRRIVKTYNKETRQPTGFNAEHPQSLVLNFRVYSTVQSSKIYELGSITFGEQEHKGTLEYVGETDPSSDVSRQILGRLVKQMMMRLKLVKYGRKYFDPNQKTEFAQHHLSLLQGYDSIITLKNERVMLQIDSCIKMIRNESYLEVIKGITEKDERYGELVGGIVQSNYGNKQFYRVNGIDYEQTPQSVFQVNSGKKQDNGEPILMDQSYLKYYQERYNISIKNPNQPLIKCIQKRRGQEQTLYLIPELMNPTGETKQQKADFRLQIELGRVKHVAPNKKMEQSQNFLKTLKQQSQESFNNWGINIEEKPIAVEYDRINPGSIKMAQKDINIDREDLDRGTQAPMLKMPFQNGIDKLLVVYNERSQDMCDSFLQTFSQSVEFMKFKINNAPRCVAVRETKGFQSWREAIDANVGAQLVICLLQGPKKKGRHYNELKIYLNNVIGVFSQCILESTIKNQKGLRVVCNKLIVKITSKTGGIPYTISEIPDRFGKKPSMVCGIDIFHSPRHDQQSILAFVATIESNFGKYFSQTHLMINGNEVSTNLRNILRNAIDAFGKINKCAPANIILYRDGVSGGQIQAIKDNEVPQLRGAIEFFGERTKDTKLAYVIVNKRVATKVFSVNDGNLQHAASPQSGTVVSNALINDYTNEDFFLISQKAKQGIAIPTHYRVIYNTLPDNVNDSQQIRASICDLQVLTYKLCFLYYNCTHAIKIPAPAKLAHRLSNYVGDKYQKGKTDTYINAKPTILDHRSLYFL